MDANAWFGTCKDSETVTSDSFLSVLFCKIFRTLLKQFMHMSFTIIIAF